MEWFFVQCGVLFSADLPVMMSLMVAGLLGSITHCSLMCGPLVAAQTIEKALSPSIIPPLLSYHAGRLSTYSLLGALSVIAGHFIFAGGLEIAMHGAMITAGVLFLGSAIFPRATHACCEPPVFAKLAQYLPRLPAALRYYLRGLLMGFMPCGLVVAALLLATTLQHPLLAAGGMLLFGLGTTPMLQLAGWGAHSLQRIHPRVARVASRSTLALNGALLCAVGLNIMTL